MRKPAPTFGFLAIVGVVAAAGVALALPQPRSFARRGLLFGGPLIEVTVPLPGQVVAQGGVAVLIRFPRSEQTLASSLRCLLDGEDVTERLTLGGNGAAGSIWSARDGVHRLRVEVFGRTWWHGPYFEDWVELEFRIRGNPSLDRA